jgi:hypothetical protein
MKKFLALTLVMMIACALLAGCARENVDPILENTATPAPSATDAPTASTAPSGTPQVTPAPTVTPVVTSENEEMVEVIDAGFDELYKKSDYVIIGQLTKSLGEWNQARKKDGSLFKDIFMMEKQYTLEITEVLKGKDVKAKDNVTLSLPYRDKFQGDADYTMRTFQEPPLNQSMLFFLSKDDSVTGTVIYYPLNEPHSFLIKDDKLYTFGNSADLAKSFAGGDGAADKGISLAAAKKEMGVK